MIVRSRKVGVISCSGEEICEGTISRLATRKVLEEMRPGQTVTICLPLFLAGNEGERSFARAYPTVTVDGCAKACARRGTEAHSGPVSASLVVSDILLEAGIRVSGETSARRLNGADAAAVNLLADRITAEVDRFVLPVVHELSDEPADCECMKAVPAGEIVVDGREIQVAALPLIFERLAAAGLAADAAAGPRLLAMVGIYHDVASMDQAATEAALVAAYQEHCARRLGEE